MSRAWKHVILFPLRIYFSVFHSPSRALKDFHSTQPPLITTLDYPVKMLRAKKINWFRMFDIKLFPFSTLDIFTSVHLPKLVSFLPPIATLTFVTCSGLYLNAWKCGPAGSWGRKALCTHMSYDSASTFLSCLSFQWASFLLSARLNNISSLFTPILSHFDCDISFNLNLYP